MEISKLFCIFKRFPHFSESIFNNLDNQSLINCKEASRELSEFLESERFFWIRMLRNYSKHYHTFQDSWKMAINKTSVEIVKHLALATKAFFKSPDTLNYEIKPNGFPEASGTKPKQSTPIHVAADFGNLELIEHVLEKIRKIIPSGSVMIIPPGNLMSAGIRHILFSYSPDKISVRPYNGPVGDKKSITLHSAARKGHFAVCGLMIGSSFSQSADWKNLIVAVANSHVEIVKLLLTEKLEEKIIPRILEEHSFIWKP